MDATLRSWGRRSRLDAAVAGLKAPWKGSGKGVFSGIPEVPNHRELGFAECPTGHSHQKIVALAWSARDKIILRTPSEAIAIEMKVER